MAKKNSISYLDSGVDLETAATLVDSYRPALEATKTPGVVSDIGSFGALFSMAQAGFSHRSLLVSATDGVGTKLDLVARLNRYEHVGQDLVAMVVNDIATFGAKPLFFLDYVATNKMDINKAKEIINGIASACASCGCALVGGESAEMPGFYSNDAYDLVGFCVGGVEPQHLISKKNITSDDVLIGFASSGFHANGFSLIREIIVQKKLNLSSKLPGSDPERTHSLGDHLLRPTRIYVGLIQSIMKQVLPRGLAHITGGGLKTNVPRMLPDHVAARIDASSWPCPPIIDFFCTQGNVTREEALGVFNMGIGLVGAFDRSDLHTVLTISKEFGIPAYEIGSTFACENETKVSFL